MRRKDDLGEDLTAERAEALGREHLAATSLTGVGKAAKGILRAMDARSNLLE